MALDNIRQEWSEMDPKFRWVIVALAVRATGFLGIRAMQPDKPKAVPVNKTAPMEGADGRTVDPFKTRLLPETPRNQGLEDLKLQVERLADELAKSKRPGAGGNQASDAAAAAASAASGAASARTAGVDLNAGLPPPVNFDAPAGSGRAGASVGKSAGKSAGLPPGEPGAEIAPLAPAAPVERMKVWEPEAAGDSTGASISGPVIPVNSALEAVMLTGINARPSGSIGGAVGSVNSANKVGAPFVSRVKGEAIMPNGWRLADLGDCFLGGSGIAILSTERAYVIADNLSCIATNGEVYEAPVKAYGVDVDGTLGIAGKVVSKQGSLLLQAALTGMASGLGSALSPSSLPSYNSNATSGSTTGVQYPNPAAVAQTAVGQGINQAAGQLSKFYLEYAKEVFPVVEVTSNTRVTWVLTESVELKRQTKKVALK